MTRKLIGGVLAALAVGTPLVAVAEAAKPKNGTYIDPKLQVYIVVKSAGSVVKSFQSPCLVTPAGGAQTTQGSFILKKHVKVSKKGKLSYAGPATLQETYRKVAINVTIAGRFKHGKAKGTVTFDAATAACEKTTFSAKYYGLHPQG